MRIAKTTALTACDALMRGDVNDAQQLIRDGEPFDLLSYITFTLSLRVEDRTDILRMMSGFCPSGLCQHHRQRNST